MKFVHLTPQPSIARVKQNGIRFGSGRRGRGVYAVPLMFLEQVSHINSDTVMPAQPRSSTTLWRWLATSKRRHSHVAAIIFQTTAAHWPANLYIELRAETGTDWLTNIDPRSVTVANDDLQWVRDAHSQGWAADLQLLIHNTSGLGKVLQMIQSCGHTTLDRRDESIEIVFPSAVAPNLIERITPLYRTNKQFKLARKRHQKAD
jgi:hypothetical protein